jgi:hypothetical protein
LSFGHDSDVLSDCWCVLSTNIIRTCLCERALDWRAYKVGLVCEEVDEVDVSDVGYI